ncbi:MAG: tRNA (adenosine(37)-N6)-threonylcarbamoyltransferase complex dimerization subunit type 1 TsaB [Chloroherpetonaceae bacterium]
MNLLAIDCTEAPLTVASSTQERVVVKRCERWQKSGEQIVSLIDEALQTLNVKPSDLDAVALSSGPGSFTALRIGIATAKGLCFAHDIPLVMIPTFEALARVTFPKIQAQTLFTVAYSKADEFYVGVASRSASMEYDYLTLSQLNGRFQTMGAVAVVGRNLSRWVSLFETSEVIDADFFTAESLLAIAKEKRMRGEITDLAMASPLYLKNFEVKKKS